MWWRSSMWAVLVLGAGCDRVFQLDRDFDAPLPIDSSVDAPLDASLAICPQGYQAIAGGETRYRFPQRQTTWLDAQGDCTDDSTPSITHLVELGSVAELVALQAVFPVATAWNAWTGYARDPGSDPYLFFSSTGVPFGLSEPAWATGEPDASTMFGEETVTLFGNDHEIWDGPSVSGFYYICECDGRLVTRTFNVAD